MFIQAFLTDIREKLNDKISPQLWSNSELYSFVVDGVREITRELPIFISEIELNILTDTNFYPIDNLVSVIEFRQNPRKPIKVDLEKLGFYYDVESSFVLAFSEEVSGIYVAPIPSESYTAMLICHVLASFDNNDTIPLPSEYLTILTNYVLYRAYCKDESEINPQRSLFFYSLYKEQIDRERLRLISKREGFRTSVVHRGLL